MGSLAGKVVLVTRSRERAGELSARLRERGATPLEAPAIRIEPATEAGPLDGAVREAADGRFEWVVFTSAAGVEAWFGRAEATGAGLPRAPVAAVGSGTAEALRAHGVTPDLVPPAFTTAALGEAFPRGAGPVALPRADIAAGDLEEVLAAKGWTPVRVDAYRSRPEPALPEDAAAALRDRRVDALLFTSRSTVEGFVALAGVVDGPAVVCIGPVTAQAAEEAGFRVRAVAEPHTLDGLVDALERALDG